MAPPPASPSPGAAAGEAAGPAAGPALGLEESAARIRSYLWVEERTFEVLGGWVPTVPEHRVKAVLAAQSRVHGWHAELWRERLPAPAGMPVDRLVAPPHGRLAPFLDALAGRGAPTGTVERLTAAYEVLLPAKIAAYGSHLARASAVADGATCRWLRLVIADEQADLASGRSLLAELAGGAGGAGDGAGHGGGRVAGHRARLEGLLDAAGGITGFDRPIVRTAPGEQGSGALGSN